MNNDEIKKLADEIARDLFTNGSGSKAERLVLIAEDGRNLGGWCESAVSDRIADALKART